MTYRNRRVVWAAVNLAVCLWIVSLSSEFAQSAEPAQSSDEHPLVPVIKMASEGLQRIDASIDDYSCTLVKRERLQGELSDHQYIFTKVRHEPFSVYMYFLGPEELKGREVLYIEGQNDNKMRAHEGTGWKKNFGMVSLEPTSSLAMNGQRYPITMVGMRTLIVRLVEIGEEDMAYDEVEVKNFKGGKINGRVCTCVQAVHPVQRKHFRFHLARIFIDDELQVPIRYAAYLWPAKEGGKPVLDEEYTYLNLKLNNGFTDEDFDYRNENYRFVKRNRR